jgi:hypothetical protein
LRFPRKSSTKAQQQVLADAPVQQTAKGVSMRSFVLWLGPALMVSIAYMDPGNYGTDIAAGAAFKYDLLWAAWFAGGMAVNSELPLVIRFLNWLGCRL